MECGNSLPLSFCRGAAFPSVLFAISYACFKARPRSGIERIRIPVAWNTALPTAGAMPTIGRGDRSNQRLLSVQAL